MNRHKCEFCGTSQILTDIWSCVKCGAPLSPPEKPTLIQRILSVVQNVDFAEGIDISKWQGDMDFTKTASMADFVILKSSENVWGDVKYEQNVGLCEEYNVYYGVYHFCRPEYDWKAQAEFFADRVVGQLPAWADLERNGALSPSALQTWLYNFVSLVEDKTGYPVGIYTRGLWWNTYVGRNNWAGSHPLWVARYSDYLTGPWSDGKYQPYEWDNWTLWQWSADGNGEGALYGAQSNSIDKDRFNGTFEDFEKWLNIDTTPPSDPELEARVASLEVRVTNLEDSIIIVNTVAGENSKDIDDLDKRVEDIEKDKPEPDGTVWALVTGDKAVAFYAHSYNDADRPIMVKKEPVVRYETGDKIKVYPNRVDADGSIDYYMLFYPGDLLYVRADKIAIL